MADNNQPKKKGPSSIVPILKKTGRSALRIGASSWMRSVMILAAIGLIGWLMYVNVWEPLQQEITLPPGISHQNPQLDEASLQGISRARAERAAYSPRLSDTLDKQFAVQQGSKP
jgi:hypothetical protein